MTILSYIEVCDVSARISDECSIGVFHYSALYLCCMHFLFEPVLSGAHNPYGAYRFLVLLMFKLAYLFMQVAYPFGKLNSIRYGG